MFTVGPRIMSRPRAFISSPIACPSLWSKAMSQVAAIATPAGKAVVVVFIFEPGALVSEEGPAQDLMPIGPSAIFIAGMPSRSFGTLSIQLAPLNMATFSSNVMRLSRSRTRSSTAKRGFLYGGILEALWFCAMPRTAGKKIKKNRRLIFFLARTAPLYKLSAIEATCR